MKKHNSTNLEEVVRGARGDAGGVWDVVEHGPEVLDARNRVDLSKRDVRACSTTIS